MISTPPSTTSTPARNVPGKPSTENDNPAFSPKRFFSQEGEDRSSQLELKRRHVDPEPASRRAPLDPLSASDLANRRIRRSHSINSFSHHSLIMPPSLPDFLVLQPEQPSSSGSWGMQLNDSSSNPMCSWPPPIPTTGSGRSSHSSSFVGQETSQYPLLHSLDENCLSRATYFGPPDPLRTEHTTRVSFIRSTDMLQPVRSRTLSLPSAREPPSVLWESSAGQTEMLHELGDAADLLLYPTPPGLSPPSEFRRSSVDPLSSGPVSLSLALGSHPIKATEPTKAVLPIGAERSRVMSIPSHSPASSPSPPPSPCLRANWRGDTSATSMTSLEKAQAATDNATVSKEDLERLLRHTIWNKHAPKIVSPLNPLRAATPASDLTADLAHFSRIMPSQSSYLSPRYSKCPPKRTRILCDNYQSLDWQTTCTHCQECKRDTVCKRLLALRYRQRQTHHFQAQRMMRPSLNLVLPYRSGTNVTVVGDERTALANHIREVFAYDIDEEEKNLWEEVAAATTMASPSVSRISLPCATAATFHRGADDSDDDVYVEMPDDGLLANEFATLYCDVSVY